MNLPLKELTYYLANGITENDVKQAQYKIYAHICPDGMYVGMTDNLATGWRQHIDNSELASSMGDNDSLNEALRKHRDVFTHYILGVASNEKSAETRKACAIEYYKPTLNDNNEMCDSDRDFRFATLNNDNLYPVLVIKDQKATK